MYYLQVVEADRYKTLAEDNRINLRLLPPPRGRIVDRFGLPLASNRQDFRVVLVREHAGDVGRVLDALAQIIELTEHDRKRVLREVSRKRSFVRSEEHTSELQSLMRISYAVFCLKKKKNTQQKSNKAN